MMAAAAAAPDRALWRRLLAEPTFQVLAAAALAVLGLGALRAASLHGLDEDLYWRAKVAWRACADVVVVGDSRALSAVSPPALAAELPGARVLNFGFVGERFRPEYLEAVAPVLDPASGARRILLGITPAALTAGSPNPRRSWFLRYRQTLAAETAVERRLVAPLAAYLKPASPKELVESAAIVAGWRQPKVVYLPDGWVTCWPQGPLEREELDNYRLTFTHERPAPERRAAVLAWTARWTRAGIRVYGFRPPTSPAMVALETELAGFDEAAFARDFTAAGGVWLAVEPADYPAFDDSHLDAPTAQRFTRALAERLRAGEARPAAAAP